MALIKCPECGYEVSDKAKECPNCGYPVVDMLISTNVSGKCNMIDKDNYVICSECGHRISVTNIVCPSCGYSVANTLSGLNNTIFCVINGKKENIVWIKEYLETLNDDGKLFYYLERLFQKTVKYKEAKKNGPQFSDASEEEIYNKIQLLYVEIMNRCNLSFDSSVRLLNKLLDTDFKLKEFRGQSLNSWKFEQTLPKKRPFYNYRLVFGIALFILCTVFFINAVVWGLVDIAVMWIAMFLWGWALWFIYKGGKELKDIQKKYDYCHNKDE